MASTETRPSFRLPWSAAIGGSGEPSHSPAEASIVGDVEHDSEETETPEMIESAAPRPLPLQPEQPSAAPARRATKFMAELSQAMQAAAEHARNETMARFEAEAKTVIEEIHANATTEVADLRRKADDDVAAIRDWSKTEIARIREETDARVAARKTGLDSEMEANASAVQARADRVASVVAAFEIEMDTFFARLNGEEDPTRIATMAETMPDPPSLEDVVAAIVATSAPSSTAPAVVPEPETESIGEPEPVAEAEPQTHAAIAEAEIDFAAAEAEALSFDGDVSALGDEDDGQATTEPADTPAADTAEPIAELDAVASEPGVQVTTRVVAAGLVSVASIANFKRSLARIGGVSSIGVSSGPNGEFIFTVTHGNSLSLSSEIVSLSGFDAQVTGQSDGEIFVSAQDRDATD